VLAAQVWKAAKRELDDIESLVRTGEFEPIHKWLTTNIHQHGQRYETQDLIQRATGETLTAGYFTDYVSEKYAEIYQL
jgi:carboxypeptidase Taq